MEIDQQRQAFLNLLGELRDEQAYQEFLERHTRFVPREFIQHHGVHLGLVLRKLPFGPDYKSDFFYFSKSSADWNAVFIEIEKPSSKFFKGSTNDFHPDFLGAIQQINQWRAWLKSERNRGAFLSTVSSIHVPIKMSLNPVYHKFVLVFGRRSEYGENQDRRQLVHAMEQHDFKILSYDSLMEDLENKNEVCIGSRHNQFIDVLTEEVTSANLYVWVDPSQLRVSKALHERLLNGPRSRSFVSTPDGSVEALTRAASLVRVRSD